MAPKNKKTTLWNKLITWLKRESVSVEIALFPLGFFILDMVIRTILKIELSDAGADMSLLATSSMASSVFLCIECGDKPGAKASFFLTLFFLTLWILILWIITFNTPFPYIINGVALGIGISSFIAAFYLSKGLNND